MVSLIKAFACFSWLGHPLKDGKDAYRREVLVEEMQMWVDEIPEQQQEDLQKLIEAFDGKHGEKAFQRINSSRLRCEVLMAHEIDNACQNKENYS